MAAYTEEERIELINTICEEISKGRSLRAVLRDKGMPDRTTFYNWIDDNKERINQYAGACEARADAIFEDMFDIADNQESDTIKLDDGTEVTNHNVIQRARLRVDTRKWILSKMQPKKYGDKLELDNKHSGSVKLTDLSNLSTDELIKRAKAAKELEKNAKNEQTD